MKGSLPLAASIYVGKFCKFHYNTNILGLGIMRHYDSSWSKVNDILSYHDCNCVFANQRRISIQIRVCVFGKKKKKLLVGWCDLHARSSVHEDQSLVCLLPYLHTIIRVAGWGTSSSLKPNGMQFFPSTHGMNTSNPTTTTQTHACPYNKCILPTMLVDRVMSLRLAQSKLTDLFSRSRITHVRMICFPTRTDWFPELACRSM